MPGTFRVPNTNFYRAPEHLADDEKAFGLYAANRIEEAILAEGPDTVAAVFLEPVQNAGGCFPPPPGYFQRVREICDQYDVLLVSDEVICAYGRLGTMFGAQKFDYVPDIITTAKGLTSGYSPLGATLISDRIFAPFAKADVSFAHGYTFGGHPVSCAVALANLDLMESEDLLGNVLRNENDFRRTLEKLEDLPIVGNVRGDGYFYGIEMVKDKVTKETFSAGRERAHPARIPVARAVRRRAVLPGRRPRRPRRAAGAAADRRPGDLRRDRADPAGRAERGLDAAVVAEPLWWEGVSRTPRDPLPGDHSCRRGGRRCRLHRAVDGLVPDARRPVAADRGAGAGVRRVRRVRPQRRLGVGPVPGVERRAGPALRAGRGPGDARRRSGRPSTRSTRSPATSCRTRT